MPKRSNDFQRLICMLHQQLARGGDASIQESVFFADQETGQLREVDIVVERQTAGNTTRICIECCSTARRATVEWVEQMACKHEALPRAKLILISKSGFTKFAKKKAAARDIDAVELGEALCLDWTTIVGKHAELVLQLAKPEVRNAAAIYKDAEGKLHRVEVAREDVLEWLESEQSFTVGSVLDLVLANLRGPTLDRTQQPGSHNFWFELELPQPCPTLRLDDGNVIRVERLRADLTVASQRGGMPLESHDYLGTPVAFGKAQFALSDVLATIVERPGSLPAIGMTEVHRKNRSEDTKG